MIQGVHSLFIVRTKRFVVTTKKSKIGRLDKKINGAWNTRITGGYKNEENQHFIISRPHFHIFSIFST
jgi:hypothetical protein